MEVSVKLLYLFIFIATLRILLVYILLLCFGFYSISLFCYIYPSCFHTTAVSTPHFLLLTHCTSPSSYWSTNLLSPLHPLLLSYPPKPHLQFTFMIFTYINPLDTKRRLLYLKTQFVPRSKHFSSRL